MVHTKPWYSSPVEVVLRPYCPEERAAVIEVIDAVCAEGRWLETPRYVPTPAWEHALHNAGECPPAPANAELTRYPWKDGSCPGHLLLVACSGGEVIGWCRTFPEKSPGGNWVNTVEIGLGLLPAYRNQGIGTRLVAHSVSWAYRMGFETIEAWTRPYNQPAQRVFVKNGFALWSAPTTVMRIPPGLPKPPTGNLRLGRRIA